jgi:non-ribosomal peptide synthetase component F
MDAESGGSRSDLYLELTDRPNGVIRRAQYNSDLFESASVQRIARHYQIFLEAVTSDPNKHPVGCPRTPFAIDLEWLVRGIVFQCQQ